jgi:hypothetical protein
MRRSRRQAAVQLERRQPLHQRFAEGSADGHHLPHRLHRRAQGRRAGGELFERPARDLDHGVVQRRLESGEGLAGDVVGDLVEGVADRQQGGDLGDRKTGRLGRQRRAARHARVHLDDDTFAGRGIDAELDVGAAGRHSHPPDHLEGVVAHLLVFAVGEGLLRRHGDRIAGVHAHGVDVFHRADDDGVVGGVAHHFQLELLPTDHRLLDQHAAGGAGLQRPLHHVFQLVAVEGGAAALAAQGEAGPHDQRVADAGGDLARFLQAAGVAAVRHLQPHLLHRLLEQLAVFAQAQGVDRRSQHFDAQALQGAALGKRDRQVDAGLTADRGQQRVGALVLEDLFDHLWEQRLDVGGVGHVGVGHDRRRVGVDQHDAIPLAPQRAAGLGARIVEFAGLADNDRTGAEDQDGADVLAFRHGSGIRCARRGRQAAVAGQRRWPARRQTFPPPAGPGRSRRDRRPAGAAAATAAAPAGRG